MYNDYKDKIIFFHKTIFLKMLWDCSVSLSLSISRSVSAFVSLNQQKIILFFVLFLSYFETVWVCLSRKWTPRNSQYMTQSRKVLRKHVSLEIWTCHIGNKNHGYSFQINTYIIFISFASLKIAFVFFWVEKIPVLKQIWQILALSETI